MSYQDIKQTTDVSSLTDSQKYSLHLEDVIWMGVRFIFYSALLVGFILVITWEAKNAPHETLFSEQSLLEYLQEASLFCTAILCLFIYRIFPDKKALALLLGGAALVALIREFDSFFDSKVFDGAWQVFVMITMALVIVSLVPLRKTILPLISDFIQRKSFGIVFSGFLTVFVFSRMFGRGIFWEAVTGEHSIRAVKNAAEEGTELLGYVLIFVGVMELLAEFYRELKLRRNP